MFETPLVYALKHSDQNIRLRSQSGGAFSIIADYVISEGGIVYGCTLNEHFEAVHVRAEDKEQKDLMRGSKYVQSNLADVFRSVKADLDASRFVLFTGTSCQIAGLRSFLKKEYENLLCVDIVCHGVPSPKVWRDYLTWQEQKNRSKLVSVNFRNKKFGWASHIETLNFVNGTEISARIYTSMFYSHTIIRPSCFKCPFKQIVHPGDITIADYWGIDKAAPEFKDEYGVSLVLINNDFGLSIFEDIKERATYIQTKLEDSMQPPLRGPYPIPPEREIFWKNYHNSSFEKIARKYSEYGFFYRFKKKMNKNIDKFKRLILKMLGKR